MTVEIQGPETEGSKYLETNSLGTLAHKFKAASKRQLLLSREAQPRRRAYGSITVRKWTILCRPH